MAQASGRARLSGTTLSRNLSRFLVLTAPAFASAAYTVAWYNVYPSDKKACFYHRPATGNFEIVGPIEYKGKRHSSVDDATMYVYYTTVASSSTACPSAAAVGATNDGQLQLWSGAVNTVGLCPNKDGELTECTWRVTQNAQVNVPTGDATSTILTNNGIGFGTCTVATNSQNEGLTLAPDSGNTVATERCTGTAFTADWVCSGIQTASFNGLIDKHSCPGAYTQLSLIGSSNDRASFPPEIFVINGASTCASECQYPSDGAQRGVPLGVMALLALMYVGR